MPMHWLMREAFGAVVDWLDQAGHVELAEQLQAEAEALAAGRAVPWWEVKA